MSPHSKKPEKNILLVEDESSYRTAILAALRKGGFHCSFCIDGDHALKKISHEKYDLLIVDFMIPGPNGLDVVKWARKQGISVPILIITNYPSDELNEHAKLLGNTKVLPKTSFNMAGLKKTVEDLLV